MGQSKTIFLCIFRHDQYEKTVFCNFTLTTRSYLDKGGPWLAILTSPLAGGLPSCPPCGPPSSPPPPPPPTPASPAPAWSVSPERRSAIADDNLADSESEVDEWSDLRVSCDFWVFLKFGFELCLVQKDGHYWWSFVELETCYSSCLSLASVRPLSCAHAPEECFLKTFYQCERRNVIST